MYTLQTFVTMDREMNNDPFVTAPFGELSTMARTYALDIQSHRRDTLPDTAIHIFDSRKDDTTEPARPMVLEATFDITSYIINRAENGQTTADAAQLKANLEADRPGTYTNIIVGDMITNGSTWMPGYIIATVLGQAEETRVRIFFSDQEFLVRYDQYHIEVVHPVDDLDQLHTSISNIADLTADIDITTMLDRLNDEAEHPYTKTRAFKFHVVNPLNPDEKIQLPWVVAIYGMAGNNIDAIYDAIRKDILDNSTHPVEEWEDRIPELFKTVEFTYVPFWDQYSVPNQGQQAALYSPIVPLIDAIPIIDSHMPSYNSTHVKDNAQVSFYLYKSIAFGVCGGPENRGEIYDIRHYYPDYAAISTQSLDFPRMTPETRDYVMRLAEQIKLAESVGEFTVLPPIYNRAWRGNRMYVVSTLNNIQHYVLAKVSYDATAPDPVDPVDPPDPVDPVDPPVAGAHFITTIDTPDGDTTAGQVMETDGTSIFTAGGQTTPGVVGVAQWDVAGAKVWAKAYQVPDAAVDYVSLHINGGSLFLAVAQEPAAGEYTTTVLEIDKTDGTILDTKKVSSASSDVIPHSVSMSGYELIIGGNH